MDLVEFDSKVGEFNNHGIMICGNPGVGKSTFINSIAPEKRVELGDSFGSGLTTEFQSINVGGLRIDPLRFTWVV